MSDTYAKQLEEQTAAATAKLVAVAQNQSGDELEFARAFIEAQYELIICLMNEKSYLIQFVRAVAEKNSHGDDGEIISSDVKKTIH